MRDRHQAETDRRTGEQPTASAYTQAAVRAEADDAAVQDQGHPAGARPRPSEHE